MAKEIYIRGIFYDDLKTLERTVRKADAVEVMASGGLTVFEAATQSVEASRVAGAILLDHKLAMLYGVADSAYPHIGIPWALSTDVVTKNPKSFIKATREVLPSMFKNHELLVNFVDARYTASIRWLSSLGFTIGPAIPFGSRNELFNMFSMTRENLRV